MVSDPGTYYARFKADMLHVALICFLDGELVAFLVHKVHEARPSVRSHDILEVFPSRINLEPKDQLTRYIAVSPRIRTLSCNSMICTSGL